MSPIEKLAGRRVVAGISGGKDSAALSLWLMEQGIDHDRVFADTGWEHEKTYEYLRGPLTAVIGPIVEVRSARTMEEWIDYKGMFPSRRAKYCTEELKIKPLAAYFEAHPLDCVDAVGIRGEESKRRAEMAEWEWMPELDVEQWRPLLHWTLDDVIAIHNRHGLVPNPLYLMGARRVGCFPCIGAGKAEVQLVGLNVDRMERLRRMESALTARAGAPRAWFQARNGINEETGRRDGRPWPIDRVVAWANDPNSPRGQLEPSGGCTKWGICDPTPEWIDNDRL